MTGTRIQLCGRITIELEGRRLEPGLPRGQGRALFAYLVLHRARPVSRAEVVDAIWPGQAPAAADADLRVLVSRLRRLLGPETLEGRSTLRLALPSDAWVDVEVAVRAVHEAEGAVHAEDWSTAVSAASTAFIIAERGFLPESDLPWVEETRQRLDDLRIRALECDGTASLAIGGSEVAAAERDARRLVELAPYRESGHRLLMQTLASQGNHAEALLAYERLRRLLRDDLGAAPSPESQTLHQQLLRDQP